MSACVVYLRVGHGTRKGITGEEEGYIRTRQNSLWAQREPTRQTGGQWGKRTVRTTYNDKYI